MKPYMRGIASLVLGTFMVLGVASSNVSAETCEDITIGETGPGSSNNVDCEVSNVVRVECKNNVYVVTDNQQNAGSGGSTTDGNTTGGDTTSGSAINENGTEVEIGAECESPAPVPAAPTKPTTPAKPAAQPAPGRGAAGPAAAPAQEVAMLPNTASNSLPTQAAIGVASLIGLLAASRLSLVAYRQLSAK